MPNAMTPSQIAEARALVVECRERAEKATPGPWAYATEDDGTISRTHIFIYVDKEEGGAIVHGCGCCDSPHTERSGNVPFIAHARTDIPALCDIVEVQAETIAELQVEVKRLKPINRALDNQLLEQGYDG